MSTNITSHNPCKNHRDRLQGLTKDNIIADIQSFILKLIDSYGATSRQWHLFEYPVGFKDGGQKANWKDFMDTAAFATYQEWIRGRIKDMDNGKKTPIRLAFFYTWKETWVGKTTEHWMTAPWHPWVAAIFSINRGDRQLFIWDCNIQLKTDGGPVYRTDLLGAQRALLDILNKKKLAITKVWLGGEGGNNNDPEICMKLTRDFLEAAAAEQDTANSFSTDIGQNLHKWTQMMNTSRPVISESEGPPKSAPLPPDRKK